MPINLSEKLQDIQGWEVDKPSTDKQWEDDIKKESLDIKNVEEVDEMLVSHENKLPRVQKNLDKFDNWPEVIRYEITEQFTQQGLEGQELADAIDKEFTERHLYYQWKVAKLNQSIERIKKARELKGVD